MPLTQTPGAHHVGFIPLFLWHSESDKTEMAVRPSLEQP